VEGITIAVAEATGIGVRVEVETTEIAAVAGAVMVVGMRTVAVALTRTVVAIVRAMQLVTAATEVVPRPQRLIPIVEPQVPVLAIMTVPMTVPVDLMTDTEEAVEATAWEQGTMSAGVLVPAIRTGPTTTAVATPGMLPRRLLLATATTASHLGAGMTTGKEEVYGPFGVLAPF
jgi:hypothetical protein